MLSAGRRAGALALCASLALLVACTPRDDDTTPPDATPPDPSPTVASGTAQQVDEPGVPDGVPVPGDGSPGTGAAAEASLTWEDGSPVEATLVDTGVARRVSLGEDVREVEAFPATPGTWTTLLAVRDDGAALVQDVSGTPGAVGYDTDSVHGPLRLVAEGRSRTLEAPSVCGGDRGDQAVAAGHVDGGVAWAVQCLGAYGVSWAAWYAPDGGAPRLVADRDASGDEGGFAGLAADGVLRDDGTFHGWDGTVETFPVVRASLLLPDGHGAVLVAEETGSGTVLTRARADGIREEVLRGSYAYPLVVDGSRVVLLVADGVVNVELWIVDTDARTALRVVGDVGVVRAVSQDRVVWAPGRFEQGPHDLVVLDLRTGETELLEMPVPIGDARVAGDLVVWTAAGSAGADEASGGPGWGVLEWPRR